MTVTGTGFISGSVVSFNGTALQTTFVSSTSLQAALPAASLAAGQTAMVTVANPAPGGGTSAGVSFAVNAPTPQITSVAPGSVLQGSSAVLLLTGTGFEANSSVLWNGAARTTVFLGTTSLQVAITAADAQSAGAGALR